MDLNHLVHYDNDSLCVFFSTWRRERACPEMILEGTVMEFVNWVLLHNGSPLPICKREKAFSPAAMHTAPAASAATVPANFKPEPTSDKEPAMMSAPELMPEPNIVLEPEPSEKSD